MNLRSITLVAGTVAVLALALGGYYFFKTTTNHKNLILRNQRELDRITRTIELRVNNFATVLENLARDPHKIRQQTEQIPGAALLCLESNPSAAKTSPSRNGSTAHDDSCPAWLPQAATSTAASLHVGRSALELFFTKPPTRSASRFGITWDHAALERSLRSDFFDQVVLVHRATQVFLPRSGKAGVRLQELPLSSSSEDCGNRGDEQPSSQEQGLERRISTVRDVTIAGEDYCLFLQPVRITLPELILQDNGELRIDGAEAKTVQADWVAGGLISKRKLRNESLALSSPTVLLLSLVLVFALLSVPFLRLALMGPRERFEMNDLYLLALSFGIAAGITGVGLADLLYLPRATSDLDAQLRNVTKKLHDNFVDEVRTAIEELKTRSLEFRCLYHWKVTQDILQDECYDFAEDNRHNISIDSKGRFGDHEKRFPKTPSPVNLPLSATLPEPWIRNGNLKMPDDPGCWRYSMVFWADPCGWQRAKWDWKTATNRISLVKRQYFQQINAGNGWRPASRPGMVSQYYIESIQSFTTGKYEAAISIPFAWDVTNNSENQDSVPNKDRCSVEKPGIAAIIVLGPHSLARSILPPGFTFAVIDANGRTLFHSRQERILQENFFEEADNKLLQSIVSSRASRALSSPYMGSAHRMFVRPISDTPLTLIVAMQQDLLSTVHFEALFESVLLFVLYAMGLLIVFFLAEAFIRCRFAWMWPDPEWPRRGRSHTAVFAAGAALVLVQAIWLSPHPSSIIVPFMAIGLGIVAWTRMEYPDRYRLWSKARWRLASTYGGLVATVSAALIVWLHAASPPAERDPILISLQALFLTFAVAVIGAPSLLGEAREVEPRRAAPFYYGAIVLLMVAGYAAGPGYGLWRSVFHEHLQLLVRHHQHEVARQLVARETRIANEKDERGFEPQTRFTDRARDLAYEGFLKTVTPSASPAATAKSSEAEGGRKSKKSGASRPAPATRIERPSPQSVERLCVQDDSTWHERFHRFIRDRIPFVTKSAVALRGLSGERIRSEGCWRSDGPLVTYERREQVLRSELPWGAQPSLAWFFCLLLASVTFWWIGMWIHRRVLLLHLEHPGPVGLARARALVQAKADGDPNILFVCDSTIHTLGLPPQTTLQIDALADHSNWRAALNDEDDDKAICIAHFDHRLEDPLANLRLLELVEELTFVRKRRVAILTSREPAVLIAGLGLPGSNAEGGVPRASRDRWTRLFAQFATVYVTDSASPCRIAVPESWPQDHGRLLKNEAANHVALCRIAKQVAKRTKLGEQPADALIDQVREMADGYYRARWQGLEPDEQLVLAQAAGGALVNPKNEPAIRSLMARGLLVRGHEIRLMNDSFGRFVRQAATGRAVEVLERGSPSAWQQARAPLYLVLIATVGFLLWTQEDFMQTAAAFVSTVGVAVGGILKAFAHVQRPSSEPGPPV